MTFTSRFAEGSVGAMFGTLAYQLLTQPVLYGVLQWPMTLAFMIVVGVVYGVIYALVHQRFAISLASCMACALSSVAIIVSVAVFFTGVGNIRPEATPLAAVALSLLTSLTGLGAYIAHRVDVD